MEERKSSAHLATSGEKNTTINTSASFITNAPFSQQLDNLPEEFFSGKRFFLVGADKIPLVKGWSNPANQHFCTNIQRFVGLDTCGHDVGDDYLFLDFDHVLDNNSKLTRGCW